MIALSIICAIELVLIGLLIKGNRSLVKERNKYRREGKRQEIKANNLEMEKEHLSSELQKFEKRNKKLCDDLAFLKFLFAFVPGDILGGPIRIRRGGNERF